MIEFNEETDSSTQIEKSGCFNLPGYKWLILSGS